MADVEGEDDLKAQKKPSPATTPENEVLGFAGIWIPWGKLVQLREVLSLLEEGTSAQISVWLLELSEMETVEREWEEGKKKKMIKKKATRRAWWWAAIEEG